MCVHVCICVCSDIVKLTAQFVAKNGANFLDKLMMREQVSGERNSVSLLAMREPASFKKRVCHKI